jgi:hypothetical protein
MIANECYVKNSTSISRELQTSLEWKWIEFLHLGNSQENFLSEEIRQEIRNEYFSITPYIERCISNFDTMLTSRYIAIEGEKYKSRLSNYFLHNFKENNNIRFLLSGQLEVLTQLKDSYKLVNIISLPTG